jgi:tetratricopeptide (TPR) repeat protein
MALTDNITPPAPPTSGSELWTLVSERIGWQKILLGLLIFALSLLAIWPGIFGGRIWDDGPLIFHNPLIKDPWGILKFWVTRHTPDYFPITSSTFWIEWRLWGFDYFAWRVVNVGFHALGAVFLWRVLKQLKIPAAWLGAALFAVHPVTVETTVWIAELKNTLSWALFMLAWMLYLDFDAVVAAEASLRRDTLESLTATMRSGQSKKWWLYGFSIAIFVLALLSKTTVVMLPVLLLLCVWWRRGRWQWADLWRTVPFFTASLVMGIITCIYQWDNASIRGYTRGIATRIAGVGWEIWFYLGKDIYPHPLLEIYPRWVIPATQWWAWLPDLALAAVLAAAWHYRRGWGRPVLMALGGFCIVLLPVLGLVKMSYWIHSLVADHLQYLGVPFFTAFLAGVGGGVAAKYRHLRIPAVLLAGVVLTLETGVSFYHSRIFAHPKEVWLHTLEYNHGSWGAYMNKGVAELNAKEYVQARRDLDTARRLNQHSGGISYDLGLMYLLRKDYPKARQEFITALKANKYRPLAIGSLAHCYLKMGRPKKALADLYRGIKMMPGSASLWFTLSVLLDHQGDYRHALAAVTQAIKLNPYDPLARYDRAYLLEKTGHWHQALAQYHQALERLPGFFQGHYMYAQALFKHGHPGAAAAQLSEIILLHVPSAQVNWHVHQLLARVLQAEGHPRQAQKQMALARRYQAALAGPKTQHAPKIPGPPSLPPDRP